MTNFIEDKEDAACCAAKNTTMYQVFENNQPISKLYSTRRQAFVDCVGRGLVINAGGRDWFADGVGIREVKEIMK